MPLRAGTKWPVPTGVRPPDTTHNLFYGWRHRRSTETSGRRQSARSAPHVATFHLPIEQFHLQIYPPPAPNGDAILPDLGAGFAPAGHQITGRKSFQLRPGTVINFDRLSGRIRPRFLTKPSAKLGANFDQKVSV